MQGNIAQLYTGQFRLTIPIGSKKVIVGVYRSWQDACLAKHAAELVARMYGKQGVFVAEENVD